jgi:hypothetical protein
MKAEVTRTYYDKKTKMPMLKGVVVDLTDERYEELTKLGFVKPVNEEENKDKFVTSKKIEGGRNSLKK